MKTVTEVSRELPVLCETDVVVIGGGAAGIGAALGAARSGARTVLIERFAFLGGCQTLTFNDSFSYIDNKIQGGIVQELVDKLVAAKATYQPSAGAKRNHWSLDEGCIYFDGEYYKRMLDVMMEEADVKMLYYSYAVDAVVEGSKIVGVVIETMEGRQVVLCKTVIDCTGIAEFAWKSGADVTGEEGYPDDRFGPYKGYHMGYGYGYFISGMDYKKFRNFAEEHVEKWDGWIKGRELFTQAKRTGELHALRSSVCFQEYEDGRAWMLAPGYSIPKGKHPWDAQLMTEATIDMRRQCWSIYELLKKNVPGFENARIEQTPSRLMFRDGHRIDGEYCLTEEDMYAGKTFDDAITCSNMHPDYFFPDGTQHCKFDIVPYDIPYRSLLSKSYDNLMAGGGALSSDMTTYVAIRYCVPSICTGQAAGTAAAMAVKSGVSPKALDVKALQAALTRQGLVTTNKNLDPALVEMYRNRAKEWQGFGL